MDFPRNRSSERIEYIGSEQKFFDLSSSGASCLHTQDIAKDSLVDMRVNELHVKAKVRYCAGRTDGFRVGVEFVDLTPDQKKAIAETVDKYSKGVPVTCLISGKLNG